MAALLLPAYLLGSEATNGPRVAGVGEQRLSEQTDELAMPTVTGPRFI